MSNNILLLEKSIGIDPHKSGWSKVSENHNKPTLPSDNVDAIEESSKSSLNLTAAIPNPLARIHLFQNAFNYFASKINAAAGREIQFEGPYAEIVSDALDFLQLLFSHPQRNSFESVNFNMGTVDSMKGNQASNERQRIANSIKQYFGEIGAVNLISFKHTNSSYLIGGTSPFTVVYTSPNWRELYQKNIAPELRLGEGADYFFDPILAPLHERSEEFRAYCKFLCNTLPNGNAFKSYVDALIQNATYSELFMFTKADGTDKFNFNTDSSDQFEIIKFEDSIVSTNGIPLRYSKLTGGGSERFYSSFKLDLSSYANKGFNFANAPLVLSESLNEVLSGENYFGSTPFDLQRYKISIKSNADSQIAINSRTIPCTQVSYPFISENDFFTDELFVLPFILNSRHFFTACSPEYENQCNFIPPLRETAFLFFDFDSLKNSFRITFEGDKVICALEFRSEKGRNIILKRSYKKPETQQRGNNLFLTVFPMVRYMESGLTPKYNNHHITFYPNPLPEFDIKVGRSGEGVSYISSVPPRSNTDQNDTSKKFVLRKSHIDFEESCHLFVDSHFDYISLRSKQNPNISGLLIPHFVIGVGANSQRYKVGIDFGTSNSHVSIRKGEGEVEDFEISSNLIGNINDSGIDYVSGLGKVNTLKIPLMTISPAEINPNIIGSDNIKFPLRTTLVHRNIDSTVIANRERDLFSFANIGFYYELDNNTRRERLLYNYATDIKPSFERDDTGFNRDFVQNFVFHILWLVKIKSIADGFKPELLNIRWTYPATGGFMEKLGTIWRNAFLKTFNNAFNPTARSLMPLSESVAPFVYLRSFRKNGEKVYDTDVNSINIDIGGGTTDFVIYTEGTSDYFSSIKFAGNDVWGGGIPVFNEDSRQFDQAQTNGFVETWKKKKQAQIETVSEDSNFLYFNAIEARVGSASEKTNILFKYEDLEFVKTLELERNRNLRLPMILHFSSILWYLCNILKSKKINDSHCITFTGKGSSYLDIIFNDKIQLQDYVKTFVTQFFKTTQSDPIEFSFNKSKGMVVEQVDEPKKVTARGAVYFETDDVRPIEQVTYLQDFESGCELDEYNEANTLDEPEIKEKVLSEVSLFMDFMLKKHKELDFLAITGIANLDELESNFGIFEFIKVDGKKKGIKLTNSFKKSYDLTKRLYQNDSSSRFFYPLKQTLYDLSITIANKLNKDQ